MSNPPLRKKCALMTQGETGTCARIPSGQSPCELLSNNRNADSGLLGRRMGLSLTEECYAPGDWNQGNRASGAVLGESVLSLVTCTQMANSDFSLFNPHAHLLLYDGRAYSYLAGLRNHPHLLRLVIEQPSVTGLPKPRYYVILT